MSNMTNYVAKNEKILRLEEMIEAVDSSLTNLDYVINQQTTLIEIVEQSAQKEQFLDFIDESKAQLENLKQQQIGLTLKKDKLSQLLELADKEDKLATMLLVFEAFKIFE